MHKYKNQNKEYARRGRTRRYQGEDYFYHTHIALLLHFISEAPVAHLVVVFFFELRITLHYLLPRPTLRAYTDPSLSLPKKRQYLLSVCKD